LIFSPNATAHASWKETRTASLVAVMRVSSTWSWRISLLALGGVFDPHASVGEELGEAVSVEELVEPLLPDAAGVAAAGHVPLNEEEVGTVRPAERVFVGVEGCQPARDAHIDAAPAVIHVGGLAVEIGPADVDGILVGVDGFGDGADDAVGDVVGAVGVGDGFGRGHVVLVGDGDSELVDHLRLARCAVGVEFALEDRNDVAHRDSRLAVPRAVVADLARWDELPGVEAFDAVNLLVDGCAPTVWGVEVGELARGGDGLRGHGGIGLGSGHEGEVGFDGGEAGRRGWGEVVGIVGADGGGVIVEQRGAQDPDAGSVCRDLTCVGCRAGLGDGADMLGSGQG